VTTASSGRNPTGPQIGGLLIATFCLLDCASVGTDETVSSSIERLERDYMVTIVATDVPDYASGMRSNIRASNPTTPSLRRYLGLLSEELAKYPSDAFICAQVDTILLAHDVRRIGARDRGRKWAGGSGASRAAIPAFRDRALVFDIQFWNDHYVRRIFHHEFFHMLDFAYRGSTDYDPEWSALNADGFRYGTGGANTSRFVDYSVPTMTDGFLSGYGKTAVEEDKAVLFEFLLMRPEIVHDRMESDPILAEKVRLMHRRLSRSCPSLEVPPKAERASDELD
jgi:hypothetical protein